MTKLNHQKIKRDLLRYAKQYRLKNAATMLSYVEVLCVNYDAFPKARILVSDPLAIPAQLLILNKLWKVENSVIKEYFQTGYLPIDPHRKLWYVPAQMGGGLSKAISIANKHPRTQVITILSDKEFRHPQVLLDLQVMREKELYYLLPVFLHSSYKNGCEGSRYLEPKFARFYHEYGQGFGSLEGSTVLDSLFIDNSLIETWTSNTLTKNKVTL